MFHWCTLKSRKNYLFYAFFLSISAVAFSHRRITQLLSFLWARRRTSGKKGDIWVQLRECFVTNGPFRLFNRVLCFALSQPQPTSMKQEIFIHFSCDSLFFVSFIKTREMPGNLWSMEASYRMKFHQRWFLCARDGIWYSDIPLHNRAEHRGNFVAVNLFL